MTTAEVRPEPEPVAPRRRMRPFSWPRRSPANGWRDEPVEPDKATTPEREPPQRRARRIRFGLSARLLTLTILFVMIAEVLIYTPSIARFRLTWLQERLAAGHLAGLSVVAAPEGMVTSDLEAELLDHVMAYMVDVRRPNEGRTYLLGPSMPPEPDSFAQLGRENIIDLIREAFDTLFNGADRTLRIEGPSPRDADVYVTMILDEHQLHKALVDFSWRILALSIAISLITASLVFLSLRWLMVRPLVDVARRVMAFRDRQEDEDTLVPTGRRGDEIGQLRRELHGMQVALRDALRQKKRLAALGTAVTKINHDLRNILATASLVSERLEQSKDPRVREVTPRLFETIDRAVHLCTATLSYSSEGTTPVKRVDIVLQDLVRAVEQDTALTCPAEAALINRVPRDFVLAGDHDQLRRAFGNLARNAFEAGASRVEVAAATRDGLALVTMADNGPGLPPRTREHLFQPFAGSARPGGTGLGLAIAHEIAGAHGGSLTLVKTDGTGTTFAFHLPIR